MSLPMVRNVLLWCTIINYGVLFVWFLVFLLAHDGLYGLHGLWFHLSRKQFDVLHYAGIALYNPRSGHSYKPLAINES